MSGKITVHGEGCYVNKPAEIKETSTGKLMARFTAMSSTDKKGPDGKYEKGPTEFWNITAWGDHARYAEEYLAEGKTSIDFVGVFSVEEYTGRDGDKRTARKVTIWDKGGTLKLHDGQTAHGTAKANGYAPEPPDDGLHSQVMQASGEDDADIPF